MDPRVEKLAKVMVKYSLNVKKGQLVRITGEHVAMPLMKAVFQHAVLAGAHPYVHLKTVELDEILLKHGSEEQIQFVPPHMMGMVKKCDAYLVVLGSSNTRMMAGVDPVKQALARKANGPLLRTVIRRSAAKEVSWCATQFPTQADAQEADMSLTDYEDFLYRAGAIHKADPVKHWRKVHREQARLCKILDRTETLRIRAEGTDLQLLVEGRKWINCDGTDNFPDGEVFTAPIENSANGHIRFSFPAVYGGREVEDVRLWFEKGKVVKQEAGKNQKYLEAMLDIDRGARFLGEVAIGTNYAIKRFSKNTLFDEKIGGTCHLALGNSIVEAGGKNTSAIHWDMVCDLKKSSEITANGKVIYRNGKFTI